MGEPVVGIDLGTSTTIIAVVENNQATVIPDAEGRRIHPSVVSFHPSGGILVGHEAKKRRVIDPRNTIASAKRLIGRTYHSPEVQAALSRSVCPIVEGPNKQPTYVVRNNQYSVPEISAFVLRHVCALAEAHIGERVKSAVITVPANFNDAQREATRAAGQIAGLNVLRILNEPTAAALAYGYGQQLTSRVVVYDFGGGTFDLTVLQLNDQIFEVLSTAGDTFLGGDDLDARLVDFMVASFLREHRIDLRYNEAAMVRLTVVAEQVKCQLSKKTKAVVEVQEIAYGDGGQPIHLQFTLHREELNAMIKDLVQNTFLICDDALRLANVSTTQIDDVVLVGGTTRMPAIRQSVQQYFNIEPRADINPDEVVAVGAAIQAAALQQTPFLGTDGQHHAAPVAAVLLDVTPRALGMAVVGGYAETIIERNAQVPVEQTRIFGTSQDGQEVVRIQVCQGESRVFDENQALGELVLEGLRPAPRGEVQIEVTFEIDTNGILQVGARDVETGHAQKAHVQLDGGLTDEQVKNFVHKHNEMPALRGEIADSPVA